MFGLLIVKTYVSDVYKYMYNKTAILICPVLKRKRKRGLSDYQTKRLKR